MDALLFKLLGAGTWTWENRQWLTLLGIFYASVKLQHMMKLQKTECSGDFKLINERILTNNKIAEKAETKAIKAIDAVKEIKPKVDDLHGWWKDKYENSKEESKAS